MSVSAEEVGRKVREAAKTASDIRGEIKRIQAEELLPAFERIAHHAGEIQETYGRLLSLLMLLQQNASPDALKEIKRARSLVNKEHQKILNEGNEQKAFSAIAIDRYFSRPKTPVIPMPKKK